MSQSSQWVDIAMAVFFIGIAGFFGAIAFALINETKPLGKFKIVRIIGGYDDGFGFICTLWIFVNAGALWMAYYYFIELHAGEPANSLRVLFGIVFLVINALILLTMKAAFLWHYSILELVFGIIVGGVTLYRIQLPIRTADILSLMASLYLLVQGFENLGTSINKQIDSSMEKITKTGNRTSKP